MSDLKSLLTGIWVNHGRLDGELVVEEARPEDHPLHTYFEWDDNIAGPKFRVIQAEKLIRRVKIETRPPSVDDGPHYVRAFISNRQAGRVGQSGYSPIEEVAKDDVSYQMMLRAFRRQVDELNRRYGHLSEYPQVMRDAAGETAV